MFRAKLEATFICVISAAIAGCAVDFPRLEDDDAGSSTDTDIDTDTDTDSDSDSDADTDSDTDADTDSGSGTGTGSETDTDTCPGFLAGVSYGTIESGDLDDPSGLVASRSHEGVLWSHNDNGDSARLFALDSSGTHLGIYDLAGATNVDWEDVAADDTYLYAGDIGDNATNRPFVVVYRVAEPTVSVDQEPVSIELTGVDAYELTYPDLAHDAETLLVDVTNGDLYLVTDEADGNSVIFRAAVPLSTTEQNLMTEVATLSFGSETLPGSLSAGAGDVSPDGDLILIRTTDSAFLWSRPTDGDLWDAFESDPCPVPLVSSETNGHAIGFDLGGEGYFTVSEEPHAPVYYFAPE